MLPAQIDTEIQITTPLVIHQAWAFGLHPTPAFPTDFQIFPLFLSIPSLREAVQNPVFWGESFPKCGWGGWFPNKVQPPQNPQAKPDFFYPKFTFRFLKSHRNPGVGGWVHTFGKVSQKTRFLEGFPKLTKQKYWDQSLIKIDQARFQSKEIERQNHLRTSILYLNLSARPGNQIINHLQNRQT